MVFYSKAITMSTLFSYFSIFQYFVCNKTEIFKFNRRVEVKGAEDYNKGQGSRQLFLRSSCYIVTSTGSPLTPKFRPLKRFHLVWQLLLERSFKIKIIYVTLKFEILLQWIIIYLKHSE